MLTILTYILLSPWAPFMPDAKSDFAEKIDLLYGFIWWAMTFFFVLIVAAMIYFPYKYRRGAQPTLTPRITHNLLLELTWSGIPALLILVIAFWGINLYVRAYVPPGDNYEVNVTGKQWLWQFEHTGGKASGLAESGELHVPMGKPINLVMSSMDVIHSFFLPDFRVKADVVPGRYTNIWFDPREPGEYQVFCAEYCGDSHSGMLAKVIVQTPEEFEKWYKGIIIFDPTVDKGKEYYQKAGCVTCHSVDGSTLVGPSFKGIFGTPQPLTNGTSVVADENYIRESILQPQAKIVKGFEGQQMPSFQGVLNDSQLNSIILYIKSLKQ
ncbi:MAG TPA: cytochrome c oxidase subunit II [Blastocatellia bacterium]|nr:cytochrome c oxidase subunit II [Blastocatellia bacterium]